MRPNTEATGFGAFAGMTLTLAGMTLTLVGMTLTLVGMTLILKRSV